MWIENIYRYTFKRLINLKLYYEFKCETYRIKISNAVIFYIFFHVGKYCFDLLLLLFEKVYIWTETALTEFYRTQIRVV